MKSGSAISAPILSRIISALPLFLPLSLPELLEGGDYSGLNRAVTGKLEPLFEQLLDGLKLPVTAIITDVELLWPINVGNQRNIPVAAHWLSGSLYSMFYHFDRFTRNRPSPVNFSGGGDELIDEIPGIPSTHLARFRTLLRENDQQFLQLVMDSISNVEQKSQYLLFSSVLEDTKFTPANDYNNEHIKWLDSQPSESVLYISFGSFLSVSKTQMDEIAAALKITGIRYFWVAREKATWLKEKFGDHVDKGLVVPWCDQLKVLSHSSVGGFWSHCGWNSTMEAVFAGVPMLTYPLFFDQFPNSRKIVDDWKNGWEVKRAEIGNEVLVTKEETAELLMKFMDVESREGKEVRDRAKGLKDICHRAIAKGGSSDVNLDAFIKSISSESLSSLCNIKKTSSSDQL
ncbi:UDP-glycosyltransferase [Quillaja saponaria]|uniref:UDP-glycosyltransferase n=1 Tax=Quillaja saponaria TaxID=32244 RepID=A0AAD7LU47_QUISA|nr:UDP-glycosyltransferase [Quillaja saponaria]